MTLYIAIATNFKNYKDITANETRRVREYLAPAYAKSFESIQNGTTFPKCTSR
ncbi:hypothetical protein [Leadbetterella sp. DM7]|uniref:hypothetical protein n=1 Tax=Leadbetterella sp. DM7 TaxID=3235085 RepID=UPI00349EE163